MYRFVIKRKRSSQSFTRARISLSYHPYLICPDATSLHLCVHTSEKIKGLSEGRADGRKDGWYNWLGHCFKTVCFLSGRMDIYSYRDARTHLKSTLWLGRLGIVQLHGLMVGRVYALLMVAVVVAIKNPMTNCISLFHCRSQAFQPENWLFESFEFSCSYVTVRRLTLDDFTSQLLQLVSDPTKTKDS